MKLLNGTTLNDADRNRFEKNLVAKNVKDLTLKRMFFSVEITVKRKLPLENAGKIKTLFGDKRKI